MWHVANRWVKTAAFQDALTINAKSCLLSFIFYLPSPNRASLRRSQTRGTKLNRIITKPDGAYFEGAFNGRWTKTLGSQVGMVLKVISKACKVLVNFFL